VTRLCYFKWHDAPGECDGRLDACHVISQRVLKREHQLANPRSPRFDFIPTPLTGTELEGVLADTRNIVAGCRAHHHRADHGFIDFEVPESARAFASELDLDHHLPVRETA
jgi:hypothetical protein